METNKLRSLIEAEMEVYLGQIKDLTAQGSNSGPHSAKLNYCHGKYEGLQWVLSKTFPVVAYHIVDNRLDSSSTDINLFAAEMKYLSDNGFDVIPMSDLGHDQAANFMYIR